MRFMSFLQFLDILVSWQGNSSKSRLACHVNFGLFLTYIIKIYFGKVKKILKTFGSKKYKRGQYP